MKKGPHHSFGLNSSTSYDEDFNHEPCQRKGHKAHWAVSAGECPPSPCALVLAPPTSPHFDPPHVLAPARAPP